MLGEMSMTQTQAWEGSQRLPPLLACPWETCIQRTGEANRPCRRVPMEALISMEYQHLAHGAQAQLPDHSQCPRALAP